MELCWICGQPAYQECTQYFQNGISRTCHYCKNHNPTTKSLKRDQIDTSETGIVYHEPTEEELYNFAMEKMAYFDKYGHGSLSD